MTEKKYTGFKSLTKPLEKESKYLSNTMKGLNVKNQENLYNII